MGTRDQTSSVTVLNIGIRNSYLADQLAQVDPKVQCHPESNNKCVSQKVMGSNPCAD